MRHWKRICAAVAFCAVAIGCRAPEVVEQAPVVRPVRMFEVGSDTVSRVLEYPGRISAEYEANVSFEVAGRIIDLPVSEGKWVTKAALLAALDPSNFEATLQADIAQRNAAEADFERFRDLLAKDAVSRRDFESRQRNFEVAEANIRISQKALDDTRLLAPFSGRVARTLVDRFQNVQAKEAVIVLQDDSTLEIKVSVPEADLVRREMAEAYAEMDKRYSPRVVVSSIPGREFPARLTELATTADPTTRTFEATFAFEAPDDLTVLSGMTASIRISAEELMVTDGYPIPAVAAPIGNTGDAYVWKVDPSSMVVSRTPVVLGDMTGSSVFVASGLAAGDLIATSGVHHLREGMEVRRIDG